MRLQEIEKRLAEVKVELENDGADIEKSCLTRLKRGRKLSVTLLSAQER